MTYKLYLDDIRNPKTAEDWVVVRSYREAHKYVCKFGYPKHISFDHDLGDHVPTGYDFAHWLVDRDLTHHEMPADFTFNVHSANPPGAANIQGLMDNYLEFRKRKDKYF